VVEDDVISHVLSFDYTNTLHIFGVSEQVIVVYCQMSKFSAISYQEQFTFIEMMMKMFALY
jgi:hypothetical protein